VTYDFRASEYQYYVFDNRPNRVLYGPFPSKVDAEVALLLTIPKDEFDQVHEKRQRRWESHHLRDLTGLHVHTASEEDIRLMLDDPQSAGYRKVTVKPSKALKRHPSWKGGWGGASAENAALYFVTGELSHLGLSGS